MYEQLDFMNLKNRNADLQRELREARLAKEAMKSEGRRSRKLVGLLAVLANALNIR